MAFPGTQSAGAAADAVLALDFVGADGVARALVEELFAPEDVEVARPTALLDDVLKRRQLSRRAHLVVVGSPPQDGIGYGLVPLVALALRASTVTLVDARSRIAKSASLSHYILSTGPFAAAQLFGSGLAVAAQRVTARPAFLTPVHGRRPGTSLRRMLYLLPSVGTTASVGGTVSHALGMLRALDQLGIDVDAVTSEPGFADTAGRQADFPTQWQIVSAPRLTKALPASAAFGLDLAVTRAIRDQWRRSDLAYQRHTRFSLAGALVARVARVPFFLEFNSPAEFFHPRAKVLSGQRRQCEDAVLAAATRIFVVSSAAKDLLLERGINEERVVVNPNGVELERFDPASVDADTRGRLGFSAGDVVFGFVGSFMEFHGVSKLAEAFVQVADVCPSARLLLVGDGEEGSRVARILEGLIDQGRVVLTGRVSPMEIPSHLAACDVLVSPHVPLQDDTPFFGSPTKLFEYMAAGKPIAASRLGQIAEVLEDERTALLVEPGDSRDLAQALERLAHDAELRGRLGRAALAEAKRYTWLAHAERVVSEFEGLPEIDDKGRRRLRRS